MTSVLWDVTLPSSEFVTNVTSNIVEIVLSEPLLPEKQVCQLMMVCRCWTAETRCWARLPICPIFVLVVLPVTHFIVFYDFPVLAESVSCVSATQVRVRFRPAPPSFSCSCLLQLTPIGIRIRPKKAANFARSSALIWEQTRRDH